MHLGEIIKEYRTTNKMSMQAFADKAGISKAYVSVLERNKDPRNGKTITPSIPVIKKIADATETAFDEVFNRLDDDLIVSLDDNQPQKAPDELVQAINSKVVQLTTPRKETVLEVATTQLEEQRAEEQAQTVTYIEEPLIEYHVYERLSAGAGATYWEDKNYDTVYYDEDISHDLASWVYGDSMEPKYLNGSVALIKATGYDYDGAIYAIDWDGQAYIKKVYKEKDGLRLVSLNPKYSDKFAPYTEDPRIIGKVVGNFQPLER